MIDKDLVKDAYRKLKGSVFYDKTLPILKADIAVYEKNINKKLEELQVALNQKDEDVWREYEQKIINNIRLFTLPKKVISSREVNERKDSPIVITNVVEDTPIVEKYNNYIDLSVDGHILGVLWILLIGYKLDDQLSETVYANRLNKQLIFEEGKTTASPSLFEPYFNKYGKWRDEALETAGEAIEAGESIILTMMDIQRYFYNVDLGSEDNYLKTIRRVIKKQDFIQERLNRFIYHVCRKVSDICGFKQTALPIGFLPSNLLSNYYLVGIDHAFSNPDFLYYGRYVDDIIYITALSETDESTILNADNYNDAVREMALKKLVDNSIICEKDDECHFCSGYENLFIEKSKNRYLYLNNNNGTTLLDKLREDIIKNGSEFRTLPDIEETIGSIWSVDRSDTTNKLRSVDKIELDKYTLSKLVSKQIIVSKYAHDEDNEEFIKQLNSSLSNSDIIEAYNLWDQCVYLCIAAHNYDKIITLIRRLAGSIEKVDEGKNKHNEYYYLTNNNIYSVQESLNMVLLSVVAKSLSGVWGEEIGTIITEINNTMKDVHEGLDSNRAWVKKFDINKLRRLFFTSKMTRKRHCISIFDELIKEKGYSDNGEIVDVDDVKHLLKTKGNKQYKIRNSYKYLPYIRSPFEILYEKLFVEILNGKIIANNDKDLIKYLEKQYGHNFGQPGYSFDKDVSIDKDTVSNLNIVTVNTTKCVNNDKLKIAIANVQMHDNDIDRILNGEKPDRTTRYEEIRSIVNQAINNEANIIIMPEAYVPMDMIPELQEKSKKHQILIICGIEHILSHNKVYNITAVLMPWEKQLNTGDQSVEYVIPIFHQKLYFSPEELRIMEEKGHDPCDGNDNPICDWNNIYFTALCCFELTSLEIRNRYSGYIDFMFGIEWNMDTNYFSNIVESYSRDALCYCVQVNNSKYGDSRIIQPTSKVKMDIVKVKGGDNATVLIGTVDVSHLKEYRDSSKRTEEPVGGKKDSEIYFKPKAAGWENKQKLLSNNSTGSSS